MYIPPAPTINALLESCLSIQTIFASLYFVALAISNAKRVDLPAPVGPNTKVCPTSRTFKFKKNGVPYEVEQVHNGTDEPQVSAVKSLKSIPCQAELKGIMFAKFFVEISGRLIFA